METAEGTVDLKPVNEMTYDAAHLDVVVKNNTDVPQKINLLSNYEDENINCEYMIGHSVKLYKYTKIMLATKHYFFDAIRLQASNVKQLENHINIIVRGINGAEKGMPIYPLAYMSPHQFNQGVIDIRIPVILDGRTEFETNLIEGMAVIFMKQMSSTKKTTPEEIEFNKASDERRLWFPVSIENLTEEDAEYNLNFNFEIQKSLLINKVEDSRFKVVVGNGNASFAELTKQLVDSEKYVVFKSIHACDNYKQFFNSDIECSDIKAQKTTFKLNDLMTVMELVDNPTEKTVITGQFLTHMTEFNSFHPINSFNKTNDSNIKFTIPAKTKIIFFIKLEPIEKNEDNN